MAQTWKIFEQQCFDYLVSEYGTKANFTKYGDSDSTNSDVLVTTSSSKFFIDIKKSSAQSGQFVLIPDTNNNVFQFSDRNKSDRNQYTDSIIEHMNSKFHAFETSGTSGKEIEMNSSIFSNWIQAYYHSKNVKYIVTKEQDYIFIPLNKIDTYFEITATYRTKRSGSGTPPKSIHQELASFLQNMYPHSDIKIDTKKMYLIIDDISLHSTKFQHKNRNYQISQTRDLNTYEIRKLSNTANANVIFSLKLIKPQSAEDFLQFENEFTI